MPYTHILFDLDGTVLDSEDGIINCTVYALGKLGIKAGDRASMKKFIGPPLKYSFVNYCGLSEEDGERALAFYRERYSDIGIWESKVYEGIPELLARLKDKGCKVLMATAKPEGFANRILAHYGIDKYFDVVSGASLDDSLNKKEDIIRLALERIGLTDKRRALMVGDRHYDIDGAKAVGIDSVGVLYGYGNIEELKEAGASYIAPEVNDIELFV